MNPKRARKNHQSRWNHRNYTTFRTHCPRRKCAGRVEATRTAETYFTVGDDGLMYESGVSGDEHWRYYCENDHRLAEEEVVKP